ncbi:MAG: hypothetical protein IAE82_03975 [Opitutaceae bacterium]|nr:hypothetical protein [Opitutaceae bacterium]
MSEEKATVVRKGPSTFQFVLFAVVIAIVAPAMHQLDVDKETVKIVGRACAAFAAALVLWGMFTKMIKLVGIILALIVGASVLVSEGVIEPPKIAEMIKDKRDK